MKTILLLLLAALLIPAAFLAADGARRGLEEIRAKLEEAA